MGLLAYDPARLGFLATALGGAADALEDVCLSGVGPDIGCGHCDGRGFAVGDEVTDYDLGAPVRIALDHETGLATLVAYPTHGTCGADVDALPVEVTYPTRVELPDEYPSQLRVYQHGDGVDGNVVFDYRFLNSETPELLGAAAPAINGSIRVRPGSPYAEGLELVILEMDLVRWRALAAETDGVPVEASAAAAQIATAYASMRARIVAGDERATVLADGYADLISTDAAATLDSTIEELCPSNPFDEPG
jgi:hypothetical protein